MKTLGSACSKIFLEKNGGSQQVIGFWPSKKWCSSGFLRFVTLKHKSIRLMSVFSSSATPLTPEPEVNLEIAEAGNHPTYQFINTIQVKFQLQKECSFGEQLMIVGDDPAFGLWDPVSAIPLSWSEGHIWTVELDIPIGKTIEYKFILKGVKGQISWQPGPDRFLKTWKTEKRIIVCEDWENAGFQKIMEEDPLTSQTDAAPNATPEMLILADILTHQGEEHISEAENEAFMLDMDPRRARKPSSLPHEKPLVVVDNASVNAKNQAPGDERNSSPRKATSNQNSLGSNGRVPTIMNSSGSEVQGNVISREGDPVLVPGLPPLSTVQSDSANHDEDERSMDFNASLGVDEVKDHNLPEETA